MKRIWVLLLFVMATSRLVAQKDQVEHTWYNEEKTSKIQVFKGSNGKFYGKIVWLQKAEDANGKPVTDTNNPDEKLRTQPVINLVILKDFTRSTDDATIYENGTVYDPKAGKTYCGKITFKGKELKLRGYLCSFSLLGRSTTWTLAD